jgi:hypothetical protein
MRTQNFYNWMENVVKSNFLADNEKMTNAFNIISEAEQIEKMRLTILSQAETIRNLKADLKSHKQFLNEVVKEMQVDFEIVKP